MAEAWIYRAAMELKAAVRPFQNVGTGQASERLQLQLIDDTLGMVLLELRNELSAVREARDLMERAVAGLGGQAAQTDTASKEMREKYDNLQVVKRTIVSALNRLAGQEHVKAGLRGRSGKAAVRSGVNG